MATPALTLTRPLPVLPSVPETDWPRIWRDILDDSKLLARMLRKRIQLDYGTYGVVYQLAGAAVKIGCIAEEEVERQVWVWKHYRRALPVLAYKPSVELSAVVRKASCPVHGPLELPEESWNCHCQEPMDVLVMPLAEPDPDAWRNPKYRKMINRVKKALDRKFHFCWDDNASNLLRYQGHIVLADFGDDTVDWW